MTMITKLILGLIAAILTASGTYLYKYSNKVVTTETKEVLPSLVITTTNATPGAAL